MTEHKYSVSEIDRMRIAVRKCLPYPSLAWSCQIGGGQSHLTPESRAAWDSFERESEDRLRTYMLAGVTPEELEQEVQKKTDAAKEKS